MLKNPVFIGMVFFVIFSLFFRGIEAQKINSRVEVKAAVKGEATTSAGLKRDSEKQGGPVVSGNQLKIPILMYHYIGNNPNPNDTARDNLSVSPEKFDEQMGYLSKAGYTPITLDTMVAGLNKTASLPQKPIVLTFDDGYEDLYYNAFPILQKYGFRSVAFIPTGLIGTRAYASWEQLAKMHSSGLISLQAHSVRHVSLTSVSTDQLNMEITESKKVLQEKFSTPVNFMAYPYGTSNQMVWNAVKKAGYVGAAGTWVSDIQSEGTIFDMPRIKIAGSISLASFASKL